MPRDPNDAYYTPKALAERLVDWAIHNSDPMDNDRTIVLEPSAGVGAVFDVLVDRLRRRSGVPDVIGVEPFSGEIPDSAVHQGGDGIFWYEKTLEDFVADWQETNLDRPFRVVAIGNPPYKLAEEHLRLLLGLAERPDVSDVEVHFLLRGSFLASGSRIRGIHAEGHLERVAHLTPRPSFTGGGTDGAEYVFARWRASLCGAKTFTSEWVDWKATK